MQSPFCNGRVRDHATVQENMAGTRIAVSGRRGKADSPASSGPTRALDDRSVAGSRGKEKRACEKDGQKAASGKVVRDEGARGCGVSARAGSVRVDSARGKATWRPCSTRHGCGRSFRSPPWRLLSLPWHSRVDHRRRPRTARLLSRKNVSVAVAVAPSVPRIAPPPVPSAAPAAASIVVTPRPVTEPRKNAGLKPATNRVTPGTSLAPVGTAAAVADPPRHENPPHTRPCPKRRLRLPLL